MQLSREEFRSFNEKMSCKYGPDKYYETRVFFIRFAEAVKLYKIKKFLKKNPACTLLDIGCGSCEIASKIAAAFKIGLDLSSYQLQCARKNNPEISFIQADTQNAPFKDNLFNHILITDVIEHVPNPAKVVEELFRISRKNAAVILSVPNDRYIKKWKKILKYLSLHHFFMPEYYLNEGDNDLENKWHLHIFSLKEIKSLLEEYFVVQEIHFIPFKFTPFQHLFILNPQK